MSFRHVFRAAVLCAAAAVVPAVTAVAEEPVSPAAASGQPPVFAAEAEAVVLDIVVRDKKGNHVPDLQAREVEVFENGVRQEIVSFRRVEGTPQALGAAASPAAPAAESGVAPLRGQSRLATFAFARLSAGARRFAEKAAADAIKSLMIPGTFVEIVRLDPVLVQVQPPTSDPELVRRAVKQATAGIAGNEGAPANLKALTAYDQGGRSAARWKGLTSSLGDQTLVQSLGVDALHALMSLVERVRSDPGRKTVVVFAEGMTIPPGLDHVYRNVISTANRANVSLYAVDVRGLDSTSDLSAARSMLEATAQVSQGQRLAGTGDNPLTQQHVGQDEMMLTALGSDSLGILEELSRSTGGLLLSQTNDFSKGFSQIGADMHGYYEAVYRPSAAGDAFHEIQVKVARKGVRVQSRSGYSGARAATDPGVAAVLSAATLPHDLETRSAVLRFGRSQNSVEHVVYLELPLTRVTLSEDAAAGRFRGALAVVGQLKDPAGQTVDVFRQDFPIEGPLAQLAAARGASATFMRRLRLPPGEYTLEWLARDAGSRKMTAERQKLAVAAQDAPVAMSSLVVVGGVEPAGKDDDPRDPLRVGDSTLSPNLGQPILVGADRNTLALYCVVYDAPGAEKTPQARIELTRGGALVAQGGGPLPQADADGRIQYISMIPIGKLTPGEYEATVRIEKDGTVASETAKLTIGS